MNNGELVAEDVALSRQGGIDGASRRSGGLKAEGDSQMLQEPSFDLGLEIAS